MRRKTATGGNATVWLVLALFFIILGILQLRSVLIDSGWYVLNSELKTEIQELRKEVHLQNDLIVGLCGELARKGFYYDCKLKEDKNDGRKGERDAGKCD